MYLNRAIVEVLGNIDIRGHIFHIIIFSKSTCAKIYFSNQAKQVLTTILAY